MPIGVGTTVSYGGNSSFIGEKLQFHRGETTVSYGRNSSAKPMGNFSHAYETVE